MSSSSSSNRPRKGRRRSSRFQTGDTRQQNNRIELRPRNNASFFNPLATRPQLPQTIVPTLRATLTQSVASYLSTSTTVPVFNASTIVPSSFSLFSEYTGLFDQYRVDLAEAWLEPIAAQGSSQFSTVATAIDLDDGNNPTSLAQVEAKQGSLTALGGAGHYHCWVPRIATAAYSGVFTSFANVGPMWLDSGSPSVQHYGFKVAFDPTPAAVIVYRLTFRIHCSFRAPGV